MGDDIEVLETGFMTHLLFCCLDGLSERGSGEGRENCVGDRVGMSKGHWEHLHSVIPHTCLKYDRVHKSKFPSNL